MKTLKIATAQFETKDNDKKANLATIQDICMKAASEGAQIVAFHECSVCGYTFAKELSYEEMLAIAEPIPSGESTKKLIQIAKKTHVAILAGFFERDEAGNIFKAHICVDESGLKAKYRKLHPFINPCIQPGNQYVVFDLKGWKCGILICYDNNIIENVRATALLGADIIFMPHVTMCTPSPRPGAGLIDPKLWENRENDPTTLRQEFDGLKGRAWLMKWLPSRAYDNAIYAIFSNPIGKDYNEIKNGCSMIIDPFGDIIAECRKLGNDYSIATIVPEKLEKAGGYRYRKARRPELYSDIIGKPHQSEQKVSWLNLK